MSRHMGHCPVCGPQKWAEVLAHIPETLRDEMAGVYENVNYRILRCPACETVYYQESRLFSEDEAWEQDASGNYVQTTPETISQWPRPLNRSEPKWLTSLRVKHTQLELALRDFYGCLNADLRAPAAVAARKVVEIAAKTLGADGRGLKDWLNWLWEQKLVSLTEHDALVALKDAGDGSAHRGWEPDLPEIELIASILEPFVERQFVTREMVEDMAARVPRRGK